jgi:hypothetical protein
MAGRGARDYAQGGGGGARGLRVAGHGLGPNGCDIFAIGGKVDMALFKLAGLHPQNRAPRRADDSGKGRDSEKP